MALHIDPANVELAPGTVERELVIVPAPAYTHIGSYKTFNGRAGTCHVTFVLRHASGVIVREPFGRYYYALGAIVVAPANPQE